jgi:large subunit ribosomal protein L5
MSSRVVVSSSNPHTPSFVARSQFPISRAREHKNNITPLHQVTLFPYANTHRRPSLEKATRSFRFRSIEFAKKRSLPFFLAVELLTQQKGIASLSQRNVIKRKIRKGIRVGCRVTLRRTSLRSFLDSRSITLPRRETRPGAKTSNISRGSGSGQIQGSITAPTTPRWTSRRDTLRSRERERRRREGIIETEGRR